MTRFLARALGASEPAFSQGIRQLERAAGEPGADIRLTEDIRRLTGAKIAELGLDPQDTKPEELYGALQYRLAQDEKLMRETLDIPADASVSEVAVRVQHFFAPYKSISQCYALKSSIAKRMLRKKPPKMALKRLGYRSLDSMLKHESAATIFAAAFLVESLAWQRLFRAQYAKLTPADFEMRPVQLVRPSGKYWQKLGEEFVASSRRNILAFKELGAVILLPSSEHVNAMTVTMILFVFEEINAIRAHSSFVKLQQVKPDFGHIMHDVCKGEAYLQAHIAGQAISWRMIQRYYAQHPDVYHQDIFEPHVQPEDLTWLHAEDAMTQLDESLRFWQGAQALGLLGEDGLVSCNIRDVALNVCNNLPFGQRVTHFVRDHMRHELMLRYLNQENLEQALRQQLSETLAAPQPAYEEFA